MINDNGLFVNTIWWDIGFLQNYSLSNDVVLCLFRFLLFFMFFGLNFNFLSFLAYSKSTNSGGAKKLNSY